MAVAELGGALVREGKSFSAAVGGSGGSAEFLA